MHSIKKRNHKCPKQIKTHKKLLKNKQSRNKKQSRNHKRKTLIKKVVGGRRTISESDGKQITTLQWKDWFIDDHQYINNTLTQGDILGQGGHGKVVIVNSETDSDIVSKIMLNPENCPRANDEYKILNEVWEELAGKTTNEINAPQPIEFLYYTKSTSSAEPPTIVGSDSNTAESNCFYSMQRIFKPKLSQILQFVKSDMEHKFRIADDGYSAPYHLFLGRISDASVIRGAWSPQPLVQTVCLSDLRHSYEWLPLSSNQLQSPDINICKLIFKNIATNYGSTGYVIANYLVDNNSTAYKWGKSMYKMIWDAYVKKRLYMNDIEFELGIYNPISEGQMRCFVIDFDRVERIGETDDLGDDEHLIRLMKTFAIEMDLTNMPIFDGRIIQSWGGFIPNPLITPDFAYNCLLSLFQLYPDDPRIYKFIKLYYASFNAHLDKYAKRTSVSYLIKLQDVQNKMFAVMEKEQNRNALFFPITSYIDSELNLYRIQEHTEIIQTFCKHWRTCYILELIHSIVHYEHQNYSKYSNQFLDIKTLMDDIENIEMNEQSSIFERAVQLTLTRWVTIYNILNTTELHGNSGERIIEDAGDAKIHNIFGDNDDDE